MQHSLEEQEIILYIKALFLFLEDSLIWII